jgi:proline iminopeptidase
MRIDVNGTRLWFDVDGPALVTDADAMRARPTLVLLHGGPGSYDHSYFKPEFARMAERAQVVYLDLRDHGRSARGDPAQWTFEQCADDVRAFCDALGIAAPIVLGHSLGGFVALLYGARHPGHAGGLVLQSTCARFDVPRTVETFRRMGGDEIAGIVARVYGGDRDSVSAEEWDRCWRLFGPWVIGARERARTITNPALNPHGLALMRAFDVRDQLARIRSSVLVCVGALDPITPVEAAREMAAGLVPGGAKLAIIEDAGHFPWKDQPARYWPLLDDFVDRARGAFGAGSPTALPTP